MSAYLLNLEARRDLSRAALFLWINPLEAAPSIALCAARNNSSAFSAPSAIAASNFLIAVRIAEVLALLASVAFLLVRTRLICDAIFGNGFTPLSYTYIITDQLFPTGIIIQKSL